MSYDEVLGEGLWQPLWPRPDFDDVAGFESSRGVEPEVAIDTNVTGFDEPSRLRPRKVRLRAAERGGQSLTDQITVDGYGGRPGVGAGAHGSASVPSPAASSSAHSSSGSGTSRYAMQFGHSCTVPAFSAGNFTIAPHSSQSTRISPVRRSR